jgi:hypothetical protein
LREKYPSIILIVTQFFEESALVSEAQAAGYVEGENLLSLKRITPYIYVVDISGVCNLRCISCLRS